MNQAVKWQTGDSTLILVSGQIFVVPGTRERFLEASREPMIQARANRDCIEFIVARDPIDPNRVNIHEEWVSEEALESFRKEGPDSDISELIERADVSQRIVMMGVT